MSKTRARLRKSPSVLWTVLALAMSALPAPGQEAATVRESAREIPVAYRVDVVVVGGSTGAVAAAVAAAENGAKVFLAAPHPYLGEDMCATLRLWLETGEEPASPLAKELFAQPAPRFHPQAMASFDYDADLPSSQRHQDTEEPSLLSDFGWDSASAQSVQYDGDVTLTVDLREETALAQAGVMVYHSNDFQVESVTVSTSPDKTNWREVAVVKNDRPPQESVGEEAIPLLTRIPEKARYLRFFVKRAPDSKRVLLGEIIAIKGGVAAAGYDVVKPLHIKRTLDDALLRAGVEFLFNCYPTAVLRDGEGNPCGIVMANRAGRQAVVAKVIIDATPRASVARMAGAQFCPFPAGEETVKRVVIGGEAKTGEGLSARKIGAPLVGKVRVGPKGKEHVVTRRYQTIEYTLRLPMSDGSYASWAKAEQIARDMTYDPAQQFASDVLFQVPPDSVKGQRPTEGEWRGADGMDIGAFRPAEVARLFVLGGCADIPREHAEKLLRPLTLMDVGRRIGAAAAEEAQALPTPTQVAAPGAKGSPSTTGDTREILIGVRPTQSLPTIPQGEGTVPVIGDYDVVVIGGGTSGAPAGIGAARQGARTLVVECLHGLGGVGTLGSITKYCGGNKVGFCTEVFGGSSWEIEQKAEWWRTTLRKAGADLWFGAVGCGALVENGKVKGVVVATPDGRGVVLAKTVIDATGNADIAAAAGAPCVYTDGTDLAIQGTGLPCRTPGANYVNTDFTIADETDMVDTWHLFVSAKSLYPKAFDLGQLIDTRERRQIVGDFTVTVLDQVNKRTFPDSIVLSSSPFDTHGYTTDPYFAFEDPKSLRTYTPYRCLLPKGLEGILVVGLGISAHRDAMPVLRMQPDLQNQGYAAGVAAAMAAKDNVGPRQVDVRALQKHLVAVGNLPESVLTDKDSYPLPPERVAAAVESIKDGYKGVAALLAQPDQALPLLRGAYAGAAGDADKLTYAHVLAVLGDATGLPTLIAAVEGTPEWDKGWAYKAMGQFGFCMSKLDSLLYAMGRTRDRRATGAIIAKVKLLDAKKEFSHHRAVALALEALGDPAAAGPLAELLAKPEMTGHAILSADAARQRTRTPLDTRVRQASLREILLARALCRCGDKDGVGKRILSEYENDLRGHFARHAKAALAEQKR